MFPQLLYRDTLFIAFSTSNSFVWSNVYLQRNKMFILCVTPKLTAVLNPVVIFVTLELYFNLPFHYNPTLELNSTDWTDKPIILKKLPFLPAPDSQVIVVIIVAYSGASVNIWRFMWVGIMTELTSVFPGDSSNHSSAFDPFSKERPLGRNYL